MGITDGSRPMALATRAEVAVMASQGETMRRKSRAANKLQFSQKVTLISSIFSMAILIAVLMGDFILLFLGKEAMPQETITTITVYGGITSTLKEVFDMNELQVIDQREILGKEFRIYGNFENPLFLAKDVAGWIEHSQADVMIKAV